MSRNHLAHRPVRSRAAHARFLSVASVALFAGAAVLGGASPALAHDELVGTAVVADDATGAPSAFELTFSNSIIEVGTEIIVTGPDGADATDGAPEITGPTVHQPLAAELAPGDYTAAWRVVSSDGHPIEGAFGLEIAEDGAGEIVAAQLGKNSPADAEQGAGADGATTDADTGADTGAEADSDAPAAESGMSTGGIIAVVVGSVAVLAGGVTAAVVANRRRAQGMAADQAPHADA